MQISKTGPNQSTTGAITQPNQNKSFKASFKGASIVGLMDAIDRGGLFASFTIQDMLGTNIPRPVMGLMRNKKENKGKSNKTFALKETIREFTTGPSMFIIPGTMLAAASKLIGRSVNVPTEFIKGLGDIFKESVTESNIKNPTQIRVDYYTNAFKNALESTTSMSDDTLSTQAKELAEQVIALDGKPKKNPIQKMSGKSIKGSYDDAFDKIVDKFTSIIKKNVSDPKIDFTSASIKDLEGATHKTSFTKLIGHIVNYGDDAIKTSSKITTDATKPFKQIVSDALDNFNFKRINTRFTMNIAMATAVVGFLAVIPKLYNISKENPGLIGLDPGVDTGTSPTGQKKTEGDNK